MTTCKSTRYGPGCGHPVEKHTGSGDCCCCNWQQNDPTHGASCPRCRPIIRAYLIRQYGDEPIPAEFREPGDPLHLIQSHPLTGRPL
jgi:hypothetical protein